jgi:DNA-binding MarR family transcriptional regulator
MANPADGRSFLLRLTPEGRAMWDQAGAELRLEVKALETLLDRPAADVQDMLRAFQAAAAAALAERPASAPR